MNAVQVRKTETKGVMLFFTLLVFCMLTILPKVLHSIMTPEIEKAPEKKHISVIEAKIKNAQAWAKIKN
ncbi:hypothetical protein [Aneurinibacillus migulanus]|uniref:Uncharacterized protein n=1 Tax=Aneurinibacillus migulanus TaxID=47500 RepID=A0A0D1XA33_ANEMI|nr:hypothetical protein [Aneurinibacillus migulanus]KIV51261.1 hypothetical protein TS65_28185 [Aneurinibacillus migulanus]KON94731.1 hypothetical protein AF333_03755 [Aneurinibacillus migulanus]MED0894737.1 hypothetical protein [Aneurinibacillus migulanus]MED1615225.1 hypothetical protein [Aneurinibacillus migulanus]SDJ12750.1 hypothetical protein SAMN04487909_11279 [Aneurinibacillus migulanus]